MFNIEHIVEMRRNKIDIGYGSSATNVVIFGLYTLKL